MERCDIYRLSISAFVIFIILSLSGCRTSGAVFIGNTLPGPVPVYEEGPPPWAPAHGYNAKHHYRYYPYHRVYFDEVSSVYFYLYGGNWCMSASLPALVQITVTDFVMLDMDDDRPYRHHSEVVKRYPHDYHKRGDQYRDDHDNNYQARIMAQEKAMEQSLDSDRNKLQKLESRNNQDNFPDKKRDSDANRSQDQDRSRTRVIEKNKSQKIDQAVSQDSVISKNRKTVYINSKTSREKDRNEDEDKENNTKRAIYRDSLIAH